MQFLNYLKKELLKIKTELYLKYKYEKAEFFLNVFLFLIFLAVISYIATKPDFLINDEPNIEYCEEVENFIDETQLNDLDDLKQLKEIEKQCK